MTLPSIVRRLTVFSRLASEEDGQALVEYALLLALIALVAFGTINVFGHGVSSLFSKVVTHFPT